MLQRLTNFYNKYMGNQLPIRIRFFNICCIGGIISAALASIAPIISGDGLPGKISSIITVLLFVVIFITAQFTKKYDACIVACIYGLNFICFPALYFTVGGIPGGMPLYFVIGIVFTALLMRGVLMVVTIFLELTTYSFIFYLTSKHPDFVTSIFDIGQKTYSDVAMDLIIVSICIGVLVKILAVLFENERKHTNELLKKLEELSIKDPLTGAYNRRFLLSYLESSILKNKKSESPVSIIMFDIDKFKLFNDDYGHLIGDEVLKNIAKILLESCRNYDIVARYGGEEFIIVLPNVNERTAFNRAEQLRQRIESSHFSEQIQIPVTVSAGTASFDKNINTPEDLISIADKNLYLAKESGRNKVVTSEIVKEDKSVQIN